MLSRTHTGLSAHVAPGLCWVRRTAQPGFGSHPPTLNLPRHAPADHHPPKVPLNDGRSDDLHDVCTVTTFCQSYDRVCFTAADHHLPKVPLNAGLGDDLHDARTVKNVQIKARVYWP